MDKILFNIAIEKFDNDNKDLMIITDQCMIVWDGRTQDTIEIHWNDNNTEYMESLSGKTFDRIFNIMDTHKILFKDSITLNAYINGIAFHHKQQYADYKGDLYNDTI